MMISNENLRHFIEQAIEAFNAHDLNRWISFYAEDALHFQPNRPKPLRGRAEIREDYLDAVSRFPLRSGSGVERR